MEEQEKYEAVTQQHQVVNFEDYAMSADAITAQVQIIQNAMRAVMKDGVHFGTIPGCGDKPTLLKPVPKRYQPPSGLPRITRLIEQTLKTATVNMSLPVP